MTVQGQQRHVHGYLRDFLFASERANAPVKALSGGERNRLLLARLFTRPANVLVLDEPTNDLDIETLELLEAQLVDWPGTLLLVSHDRAFLDNVVTSTLVFEGNGRVQEYVGGYEDWLRQRADAASNGRRNRSPARTRARHQHRPAPRNRPPAARTPPTPPPPSRRPRLPRGAQETLLQRAPRARRAPRPHRSPGDRADPARSGNRRSRLLPKPGPNHHRHPRETRNASTPPCSKPWPAGTPSTPALHDRHRAQASSIIAGPNGAGKSTIAPLILRGPLHVREFVNADDIARGLSPFNIEGAAVAAGRIMLARMRDLARQRVSFAFETTLASRTFAPWLKELNRTDTRSTWCTCGCRRLKWPPLAWPSRVTVWVDIRSLPKRFAGAIMAAYEISSACTGRLRPRGRCMTALTPDVC